MRKQLLHFKATKTSFQEEARVLHLCTLTERPLKAKYFEKQCSIERGYEPFDSIRSLDTNKKAKTWITGGLEYQLLFGEEKILKFFSKNKLL